MSWVKQLTENKTFLLSLWIAVCFGLFLNGTNSFISSSEFWSIYLSQKIFSAGYAWKAVYLKPLFHLLLSSVYLLNLNDFYHIYATKILFSTNGILQFFLIYKILSHFFKNRLSQFLLTLFLFCSPLYLSNYDRIRSDQLALTFFLFYIFISYSNAKFKSHLQIALLFIFPCIAFKHIYFSIMAIPFLPLKKYISLVKSLRIERKILLGLAVVAIAIWGFALSIPALKYVYVTYATTGFNPFQVTHLLKTEWFYIYISTLPLLYNEFRSYLKAKNIFALFYLQIIIVFFVAINPQKFDFFLASLTPLFYLLSLFFVCFLYESRTLHFSIIYTAILLFSGYSFYLAHKQSHLFTLNNPQILTIDRISNIISKYQMSYLDGMGILPKQNNLSCFVSPDDDVANANCIRLIISAQADAIIVTNRLMSLGFDFNTLDRLGYVGIGPNFYVLKKWVEKIKLEPTDWAPPIMIFSSEQLY